MLFERRKQAFEVKETGTEADLKKLRVLAKNLNITQSYVVGRQPLNVFPGYIWGGFLR